MIVQHPRIRRAAAGLVPAAALLASPLVAQDAPTAPPPVRSTVPQAATPAPSPAAAPPATSPASDAAASPTRIRPEALNVVDEARDAARAERRTARSAASQAAAPSRQPAVAEAGPATSPAPAVAPATTPSPMTTPVTAAPPPSAAAAPDMVTSGDPAAATKVPRDDATALWPLFAILGVGILAIFAFLTLRRRRAAQDEVYEEAVYDEQPRAAEPPYVADPVPETAPVAAPLHEPEVAQRRERGLGTGNYGLTAPVIRPRLPLAAAAVPVASAEPPVAAAEDVSMTDAGAEDLAALVPGAPGGGRPWLEFAMRPIRAGTNADEALVEIELTVANAGGLPAEDVRISTFMLPAGGATEAEMQRLLHGNPGESAIQSTTIAPGEGTRIDATLALRKVEIGIAGEAFSPVVVADARYRLPSGEEGRTSASFLIGIASSGHLAPLPLDDRQMHEDLEARLHGAPHRS